MNNLQRRRKRSVNPPVSTKLDFEAPQLKNSFPEPEPHRYENSVIDFYIRSGNLLKVFAINGYLERGKIRSHDSKVLLMVHEPVDGIFLMYKRAISTMEISNHPKKSDGEDSNFEPSSLLPDLHEATLISNNDLEAEWLDKFIQSRSRVTLVTMNGYHEHGTIIAHDDNSIVFIRYIGDAPNIIHKSALSTIYTNL